MYLDMPFLHRMRTATDRNSEIREMAALDFERVELEELSISEFDEGARLSDTMTIVRDGFHWAAVVGDVYFRSSPDRAESLRTALTDMMGGVDFSRFFNDGTRLPQAALLAKVPKPHLIEFSERHTNVANLVDWVRRNLVSIEGSVFMRVREPTASFNVFRSRVSDDVSMEFGVSKLISFDHPAGEFGVLATISDKEELMETGMERAKEHRADIKVSFDIKRNYLLLTSTTEDAEAVAARSLVSQARRLTLNGFRPESPPRLVKALSEFLREPGCEFDQARLDAVADLLAEHLPAIRFPGSLMVDVALDRWHNRPIGLAISGAAPSPGTAGTK